jgi:hypothetical protein
MTKASLARQNGDRFQARIFWCEALKLLDPGSPVVRVGMESGPKGFDDVWVEYDVRSAPKDQFGEPLWRDYIQCKWHETDGYYGYEDLTQPEFTCAKQFSLLQRARQAQLAAKQGDGADKRVRYTLRTTWHIEKTDPLFALKRRTDNTLRLNGDKGLINTKTARSATGKIRQRWCQHLDMDENELHDFARTLAFATTTDSLNDLRGTLDKEFARYGLRRIPANESSFLYDELMFRWLDQDKQEFDRDSFRAVCQAEELFVPPAQTVAVFGVRSFAHRAHRAPDQASDQAPDQDRPETDCRQVLDFLQHFNTRHLAKGEDWATVLYPQLQQFLLDAAHAHERLRLMLDVHVTLAFAAGAVLDLKCGRVLEVVQRAPQAQVWHRNDSQSAPGWPGWVFAHEAQARGGAELAVAVGLTREMAQDVRQFVAKNLPAIGTLIIATPAGGAAQDSVKSGRHAFGLAASLEQHIRQQRNGCAPPLHLFLCAPNAFIFFLGQHWASLGRVTLYEYDLEGGRDGSYTRSLCFPVAGGVV